MKRDAPGLELIAELCREHDLYVVFGMPERDRTDPNVLYNAAAFVGPEGILGTYRKVHLGEEPWVTLTVADSGPGIPEGDRGRVIERFVRLEQSRSQPGSGLGLSLASAVARLHGGELILSDNDPGLKSIIALPRGGPVQVRDDEPRQDESRSQEAST